MKTCKLEYMIRNMNEDSKSEIIYLFDKNSEFIFSSFNIKAVEDFKKLKPVSGDSLEAFEYKNAYYLYMSLSLRYETIFNRINEIFIENNVYPIFNDPSNLEECFVIRKDMLLAMSYNRANEFFGVNNYREYTPPKFKK